MLAAVPPLACALVGTVVGGFLPLAAYRLSVPSGVALRANCESCAWAFPPGLSGWLRPGSRCPACARRVGPSALVMATAAGAAALGAGVAVTTTRAADGSAAAGLLLGVLLLVGVMGVLLAAVDFAVLRLPDLLVVPTGVAVAALLALATAVTGDPAPLLRAVTAAALLGGAYGAFALLPGSVLGCGDVKLAAVLGGPLGWLGWPVALLGAVLPVVLGGLAALALLAAGRIRGDTPVPFGPALVAGFVLAVALP